MQHRAGTLALAAAVALLAAATPAAAQSEVDVGVLGSVSTYRPVTVTNGPNSGSVGPGLGFGAGFALGQTIDERWGGEFRYLYFRNNLKLESGGQSAELNAESHAVHYDLLYYFGGKSARVRPYVAGGIGVKYYRGRGPEDPFQPLSNLALLTATGETKLMGDFGAGIKVRAGKNAYIRAEFRDYVTGVPTKVMAAAPGAQISGILHHWAPLVGIGWTW